MNYKVLTKPLSGQEILQQCDRYGNISGYVPVTASELAGDSESIISLLSEKLIGSDLLANVSYTMVDASENTIILRVTGNVAVMLDDLERGSDSDSPAKEAACQAYEPLFYDPAIEIDAIGRQKPEPGPSKQINIYCTEPVGDGVHVNIVVLELTVKANMTRDTVIAAIADASREFCRTPEGVTIYLGNNRRFTFEDFAFYVPASIHEKYGIEAVSHDYDISVDAGMSLVGDAHLILENTTQRGVP